MPNDRVAPELLLHGVPGLAINDRLMLSGMALPLVDDLADIDRVCQQLVNVAAGEWLSAGPSIFIRPSRFGRQAEPVGILFHEPDIGVVQIELEQRSGRRAGGWWERRDYRGASPFARPRPLDRQFSAVQTAPP